MALSFTSRIVAINFLIAVVATVARPASSQVPIARVHTLPSRCTAFYFQNEPEAALQICDGSDLRNPFTPIPNLSITSLGAVHGSSWLQLIGCRLRWQCLVDSTRGLHWKIRESQAPHEARSSTPSGSDLILWSCPPYFERGSVPLKTLIETSIILAQLCG